MPSPPPCGTSMSAVIVYEVLSRFAASPLGMPVTVSPEKVNNRRPAAKLGRGTTRRVAAEASNGRT
jgi:hypothetical protein